MKRLLSIGLIIVLATMQVQSQEEKFSRYLFAYFEGGGNAAQQEHLRFAISRDAVNWRALNNNQIVVASDTISKSGGIRDPHILRGENGEYLIVATDMSSYRHGWVDNPGIVLMRSTDLVNWTHAFIELKTAFPTNFGDAYWVWAPQVIYDEEVGKYMIYFTLQRNDRKTLVTYYAYANADFTAFEAEPQMLFDAKYGSIDNDIIKGPDGKWHLFYKGNIKNSAGQEIQKGIQQAVADNLRGPYKEDFAFLDAYANNSTDVEGSSTFKLIGQQKYILMYDLYGAGRYEYQISTDLWHWTQKPLSFTKDFFPRHGSVIPITLDEAKRMAAKWPSVDLDSLLTESPWVEPDDDGGQLLVEYSFSTTTDDAGRFPYTLSGSAQCQTLNDGNTVVAIGKRNGYIDLSAHMAKSILPQIQTNHTISLDICVGADNSLSSFCWVWALANGTGQYSGMVNQAGNANWYYEIKNGSASQAYSQKGLTTDVWHTITAVQRGKMCKLYIDGQLLGSGFTDIRFSDFAKAITQCWLGRSPFGADAYMINTLFDNFRIYNKALTEEQVQALYASRPTTTEVVVTDEERIAELRQELSAAYAARYIHQSAKLPTTSSFGRVTWTYAETTPGYVTFNSNTFKVVKRDAQAVVAGTLQGEVNYNGQAFTVFDQPIPVTVAPDDNAVGYLYCHMPDLVPQTGNGLVVSQTITYALGKKEDKGLVFNELLGGNGVIKGVGTTIPWMRDAFILRDKNGNGYYMVNTDLYNSGKGGTDAADACYIGMFRSFDLINWTYTRCDVKGFLRQHPTKDIYNDAGTALLTPDKIFRVWASQLTYIGDDLYLYYGIGNSDNGQADHIYLSKVNDTFTGIEDIRMLYGDNRGAIALDADIIYLETDQRYHMFFRDVSKANIRDIACTDLLHPEWDEECVSFVDPGNFEAPSVFRRINEDVWNVGCVNWSNGPNKGYHFRTADAMLQNLKDAPAMSGNLSPQHGSFLMLSQTEWDLLQTWNDLNGVIENVKWKMNNGAGDEETIANLRSAIAKAETDLYVKRTEPVDLEALLQTLEADLEAIKAQFKSHESQFTLSADSINKLIENATPITITNGDFASNASGWTTVSTPNTANGVAEFFAAGYVDYNASIKQELRGLENGTYLVTCQAFERNGHNDGEGRNYQTGAELLRYHLFANTAQTNVCSMYSTPYSGVNSLNGYVDGMVSANNVFSASPDNYLCGVVVKVTNGRLSFGIKRDFTTVHTTDWCCFDNFRVYRLADAPTEIGAIRNGQRTMAKEAVAVYDLVGRSVATPRHGQVYIIDGKKVRF